ncbi:hypothetical protein ANN_06734 [Periplaneta americana]|uniref:DUF4371 domain-containing protein n=1 Tax=Periplaneta americana TaxID=6978 RepID=A0ABQ8TGE8_PERAM|nr:hypothetical protein ANN_06734 [Periplaneta americana]
MEENVSPVEARGRPRKCIAAPEMTKRSQTKLASVRIDTQLDQQLKSDVARHNEMVKKNREILKRLIDATCFLAMQELPFRGHGESEDSLNKGNYIELLHLLSNYDTTLREHLESSTTFKGTSNRIQNDLITAISGVLMESIKNDISMAQHVAIILDETSDVYVILMYPPLRLASGKHRSPAPKERARSLSAVCAVHLNARDRTRNLGHRRPALYQLANQVDLRVDIRTALDRAVKRDPEMMLQMESAVFQRFVNVLLTWQGSILKKFLINRYISSLVAERISRHVVVVVTGRVEEFCVLRRSVFNDMISNIRFENPHYPKDFIRVHVYYWREVECLWRDGNNLGKICIVCFAHKFHHDLAGFEPGPPGWKTSALKDAAQCLFTCHSNLVTIIVTEHAVSTTLSCEKLLDNKLCHSNAKGMRGKNLVFAIVQSCTQYWRWYATWTRLDVLYTGTLSYAHIEIRNLVRIISRENRQ